MVVIDRSALLPYSAEKLYALINDVASYPEFMADCDRVEIHRETETELEATLVLKKAGLSYQFSTHNKMRPPELIALHLIDGPFDFFDGRWEIKSLDENACKVTLQLKFILSGKLMNMALNRLVDSVANSMVDIIVGRADDLYGG